MSLRNPIQCSMEPTKTTVARYLIAEPILLLDRRSSTVLFGGRLVIMLLLQMERSVPYLWANIIFEEQAPNPREEPAHEEHCCIATRSGGQDIGAGDIHFVTLEMVEKAAWHVDSGITRGSVQAARKCRPELVVPQPSRLSGTLWANQWEWQSVIDSHPAHSFNGLTLLKKTTLGQKVEITLNRRVMDLLLLSFLVLCQANSFDTISKVLLEELPTLDLDHIIIGGYCFVDFLQNRSKICTPHRGWDVSVCPIVKVQTRVRG
ncbi:hypothetical protein IW262DRAFT_1481584 [Armillaria fumosa]|nr:hypothetical protein IW262DRAFT_1481584 [Armillaria fumosa]